MTVAEITMGAGGVVAAAGALAAVLARPTLTACYGVALMTLGAAIAFAGAVWSRGETSAIVHVAALLVVAAAQAGLGRRLCAPAAGEEDVQAADAALRSLRH